MQTPIVRPWHPLVKLVQERIGRNLLIYQGIETFIKAFVPYSHPDGARSSDEDFRRLRTAMAEKSLGPSVEKLKQSLAHDDLDQASAFDAYLREVLAARNTMTHSLLTVPGVSLHTEEGCRAAMRLLDGHLRLALPLYQLLAAHVAVLGSALGALNDAELYEVFQAIGAALEIVEGEAPPAYD